jgi:hypothetical protein
MPLRAVIPALITAVLMLCGCRTTSDHVQTGDNIPKGSRILRYEYAGGRNVRTLAFGGGVACQADGVLGPLTFSAAYAGKPGIRRLTTSEAGVLARIRRYVASSTLRFTWVGGEFIVYDAIYGVCNGGLYWVMNGGCNEFYSATDTSMESTVPGSPGWRCTPPPWSVSLNAEPR